MKRALWITVAAIALLLLAAVGWIVRLVQRPSATHEPSPRPRRERLVSAHELDEERRLMRLAAGRSSAFAH